MPFEHKSEPESNTKIICNVKGIGGIGIAINAPKAVNTEKSETKAIFLEVFVTTSILIVNLVFFVFFLIWVYLNKQKKFYILSLGNFQKRLNLLVDFTDYLALEHGTAEQETIHFRVKMFPKSIHTLSDYWQYINCLTSASEIFLINSENDPELRKMLLRHLAVTKAALIELQRVSERITKRTSVFAGSIVKIPFNLNNTEPGNERTRFLASAITNLTFHK